MSVDVSFLQAEGYQVLPEVFSESEVEALIIKLPNLESEAGTRSLLDHEWCRELALDPRLFEHVNASLGENARPVRGILFDKNPSANWNLGWHQDTKIAVSHRIEAEGFTGWSEKEGIVHCRPPVGVLESSVAVRIHLDDADESNGALMVLPKTHLNGFRSRPDEAESDRPLTCSTKRGDVLLMKPLTFHASSKAISPKHRRVLHIEYSSAKLPEDLDWAYHRLEA